MDERGDLPGGIGRFLAAFPHCQVLHDLLDDRVLVVRGRDRAEDSLLPLRVWGNGCSVPFFLKSVQVCGIIFILGFTDF